MKNCAAILRIGRVGFRFPPTALVCRRKLFVLKSTLFIADIARQTLSVLAIFNCFFWAAADTRHTVRAIIFPHRLPIVHIDIVQRTSLNAFTAGNTLTGSIEFPGMNKQWIKKVVYNAAVYGIFKRTLSLRKGRAIFNMANRLF